MSSSFPVLFPDLESATSIAAIDFETASKRPDSAISIGVAHCGGPHPWQSFYSLISPNRPSNRFYDVHGISIEKQMSAPLFQKVWPRIRESLGTQPILLSHNAAFDRQILRAMLSLSGLQSPSIRYFCTLQFARKMWPGMPCDLRSVANRIGILVDMPHHALSDALLVTEIAIRMRELTRQCT